MKTIGLLGGMSWESTAGYYQQINIEVNKRLGGLHSAKILMYSVDFDEIEKLQHLDDWEALTALLSDAALKIQNAGADFLLICTNTMHKIAPEIESELSIPIIHIADASAEQLVKDGIKKVGLLGTKFTMDQEFYKGRLFEKYGINVIVPSETEQNRVHEVIYTELCKGMIESNSRNDYLEIIQSLSERGAKAAVLGCTEIPLLVKQQHTDVPIYDTMAIHSRKAVDLALNS
ncbi:MAG: aspartate/glutamate racemase family protein [Desulfobacteraceae bacterium]|nr:aspartate/glutamate racemase family protein [Desulfobacteraceae bacterium]